MKIIVSPILKNVRELHFLKKKVNYGFPVAFGRTPKSN